MGIDLPDQKNLPKTLGNQITKLYRKLTNSLNSRLVISHLAVALVSITLMAAFTGRYIFQAANAETEHNLQDLAFAASNAIQLPIIEVREGRNNAAIYQGPAQPHLCRYREHALYGFLAGWVPAGR